MASSKSGVRPSGRWLFGVENLFVVTTDDAVLNVTTGTVCAV